MDWYVEEKQKLYLNRQAIACLNSSGSVEEKQKLYLNRTLLITSSILRTVEEKQKLYLNVKPVYRFAYPCQG